LLTGDSKNRFRKNLKRSPVVLISSNGSADLYGNANPVPVVFVPAAKDTEGVEWGQDLLKREYLTMEVAQTRPLLSRKSKRKKRSRTTAAAQVSPNVYGSACVAVLVARKRRMILRRSRLTSKLVPLVRKFHKKMMQKLWGLFLWSVVGRKEFQVLRLMDMLWYVALVALAYQAICSLRRKMTPQQRNLRQKRTAVPSVATVAVLAVAAAEESQSAVDGSAGCGAALGAVKLVAFVVLKSRSYATVCERKTLLGSFVAAVLLSIVLKSVAKK